MIKQLPILRNCFNYEEPTKKIFTKRLPQRSYITVKSVREVNDILKKVLAIGLIVLLIFGIFTPLGGSENKLNAHRVRVNKTSCIKEPIYLQPYSKQLTKTTAPQLLHPIKTFPSYLHLVMSPGLMSGEKGRLCTIPESIPTFEECNKLSKITEDNVKNKYSPEQLNDLMSQKSKSSKGLFFDTNKDIFDTQIDSISFGMDKRIARAYQEAISYVEQEILNSDEFFEKDSSAIAESIIKTNEIVTKYLTESGELRNQYSVVLDGKTEISRKGFKKAFYRYGGTFSDLKFFHSLYDKLEKFDLIDKAMRHLSADELRILNLIGHATCHPSEIISKLHICGKQIKELAVKIKNHDIDAIAAASFVHQEIVTIHPFMFGNGRTARIWMNAMLQLGGYNAIVLPNRTEYTSAVKKDLKTGTFVTYLERVIKWNRKQKNLS
ncbi:MAG: Fic family protein [Parachlamydiaceae bacterium]|nr:Fic family protein [Parachlamydiaceae bacterium]